MTVVNGRIGKVGGWLRPRSRVAAAGRSVVAMRPPYQVFVVLVLLVAAVSVGVILLINQNNRLQAVEDARRDALAAAQSHAEELLSYDYRTIEADVDRAAAATTGNFRKEYVGTFENVLFEQAKNTHAVVDAQVRAASVVRATPDQAVVLLFVNQATTKKTADETKIDQPRVQMTLKKVGDKWLVSKVESI